MISYSRLSAKVWRQVSHFGPVLAREHRQQDLEQLDREIIQWYDRVPEEVKLARWDKEYPVISTPSYNLQRLRVWTYLRLNQVRNSAQASLPRGNQTPSRLDVGVGGWRRC